jgi:hypothetical protein
MSFRHFSYGVLVGLISGVVGLSYGVRDYGKDYVSLKSRSALNDFARGAFDRGVDAVGKATIDVLGDIAEEQSRDFGRLALKWSLKKYEDYDEELRRNREQRIFNEQMEGVQIVRRS